MERRPPERPAQRFPSPEKRRPLAPAMPTATLDCHHAPDLGSVTVIFQTINVHNASTRCGLQSVGDTLAPPPPPTHARTERYQPSNPHTFFPMQPCARNLTPSRPLDSSLDAAATLSRRRAAPLRAPSAPRAARCSAAAMRAAAPPAAPPCSPLPRSPPHPSPEATHPTPRPPTLLRSRLPSRPPVAAALPLLRRAVEHLPPTRTHVWSGGGHALRGGWKRGAAYLDEQFKPFPLLNSSDEFRVQHASPGGRPYGLPQPLHGHETRRRDRPNDFQAVRLPTRRRSRTPGLPAGLPQAPEASYKGMMHARAHGRSQALSHAAARGGSRAGMYSV